MARQRRPDLPLRHHRLSQRFPFDDASFGVAFFNQVIEHLEPETGRHAVQEIHRVLRPGGMLLLFSPSRFNEKERREDPTHIHMYTPTELQGMLRNAGFNRIEPLDEPLTLLGPSALGRRLMNRIFKLAPWDRLSASANVRAFKPGGSVT
jgi:SAM-dependent methyltransferase